MHPSIFRAEMKMFGSGEFKQSYEEAKERARGGIGQPQPRNKEIKIRAFWDIAPCSLTEIDQHFRDMLL
jgi:hypothetical protein